MSEIHCEANSFFQMARKLQRKGKLEEAIALYQEAIKKNPNFSWYYHNLGDIF
ncbi:tetratricopeptide repeat protein, partial [Hydrocoleum sp. CS-953]